METFTESFRKTDSAKQVATQSSAQAQKQVQSSSTVSAGGGAVVSDGVAKLSSENISIENRSLRDGLVINCGGDQHQIYYKGTVFLQYVGETIPPGVVFPSGLVKGSVRKSTQTYSKDGNVLVPSDLLIGTTTIRNRLDLGTLVNVVRSNPPQVAFDKEQRCRVISGGVSSL